MKRSGDRTLLKALEIIAEELRDEDVVSASCIDEAILRIQELVEENK